MENEHTFEGRQAFWSESAEIKIAELRKRLKPGTSEDRLRFDNLNRALDWYAGARRLKAKEGELDKRQEEILQNQLDAIKNCDHDYDSLDDEFANFSDEELRYIRQELFLL